MLAWIFSFLIFIQSMKEYFFLSYLVRLFKISRRRDTTVICSADVGKRRLWKRCSHEFFSPWFSLSQFNRIFLSALGVSGKDFGDVQILLWPSWFELLLPLSYWSYVSFSESQGSPSLSSKSKKSTLDWLTGFLVAAEWLKAPLEAG